MTKSDPLTDDDKSIHEWQLDVAGLGEDGQRRLKQSTVMISRVGGLGSPIAWDLAAAGVGHLILAHAGTPKPSDFNRQTLMRFDRRDQNRAHQAADRLREFKPSVRVTSIDENLCEDNAQRIVGDADLIIDAAPMFQERLAMHDVAWRRGRPIIEAAMYEMQGSVMTLVPGRTACLRCLVPQPPSTWQRRFPVIAAVSSTTGSLAAIEAIKLLAGFGDTLVGRRLQFDLRSMRFHTTTVARNPNCQFCHHENLTGSVGTAAP